jgi:hypothetical protein
MKHYHEGLLQRIEQLDRLKPDEIFDLADWIEALERIEAYRKKHDQYADLQDELAAAEKYLHKWKETKTATYKTVGLEELKHADQMITLALQTGEDRERIQAYQAKHKELTSKF